MNWPRYRNRYLASFSLQQIRHLPHKDQACVVIPTGAVEQHGPQLPVGVDALLAQAYLDRALPLLPDSAPIYVAPPIQVGKSNEHDGFPGTLIISRESLRQQLLAIGTQLSQWGFQKIAILNTHGGNISVIKSVLRELALDANLEGKVLQFPYQIDINDRERAYGIHANEVESSLMYYLTPNQVAPEKATCSWMRAEGDDAELQAEFAASTFAWKTLDLSPTGTMGDATVATAEKGELWINRAAQALALALLQRVK
jgi:creatinine amidohydrolase